MGKIESFPPWMKVGTVFRWSEGTENDCHYMIGNIQITAMIVVVVKPASNGTRPYNTTKVLTIEHLKYKPIEVGPRNFIRRKDNGFKRTKSG